MYLLVLVQIPSQVKALFTHRTREGFFARVYAPVVDATCAPRETFKAYVTLVGLVSAMHFHVFDERSFFCEALSAVFASEGLFACVCARMSCKGALTGEVFSAHVAFVWAL